MLSNRGRALVGGLFALVAAAAAEPRGLKRSQLAVKAHQQAHSLQFIPMREGVMTNNVALISFANSADGPEVIHTIYSSSRLGYPEDDVDPDAPAVRPLGNSADVSPGRANTVVRVKLNPERTSMPVPRPMKS